jgi:hypothetical protein
MTAVRRGRGIALIVGTLTATFAVTLAAAFAATGHRPEGAGGPGGSAGAGAARPSQTTLHLHVTGCDHCTLQLQHAVSGNPDVWTSKSKVIGSDQVVVFRTRTAHTRGMSFVLRAPWAGNTGAVPNIVTRYAGHAAGSFVTRRAAHHAGRAEGCWAGTGSSDHRLDFRVARVVGKSVTGEDTLMPLAYAPHTLKSWRPMARTYRGTIGNQDAFYCTR